MQGPLFLHALPMKETRCDGQSLSKGLCTKVGEILLPSQLSAALQIGDNPLTAHFQGDMDRKRRKGKGWAVIATYYCCSSTPIHRFGFREDKPARIGVGGAIWKLATTCQMWECEIPTRKGISRG